jgi:hypothetical protein
MNTYASHISAALLWRVPLLHAVLGYPTAEALENALPLEQITAPIENKRLRLDKAQGYVDSFPLPNNAVVKHGDEWVASPELVFLELATSLGFHRTVLLGMQLCSSTIGGEALTNVSRIRKFLAKTPGHNGQRTASQAARYLADNSASIMESLLYMFLVLPNMYGGYGLSGAELNHEISLENKNTSLTNRRVFVDLFWSKAKLAVEYDSFEHHGSMGSWIKDTRRLAAIERLGYKTLSINTAQLYNAQALEEVALVIAAHLGKRIRIRTDRFTPAHSELRSLLPRNT